jgi:hypothetical protein
MRIHSSGNVGINSSNPSAKLTVEGTFSVRTSSNQSFNDSNNANNLTMTDSKSHFNLDGADKDFQISSDTVTHALFVRGSDGNVGIGTTSPSATLHVEDTVTGGGNSGHMKLGHTRTRTFYAGISSSENRWYKVLNYGTGNMFTGKVQIYLTREGGFNQTGAHKEYRASLGGYSNSVYGPLSLSGDGGEGGVASLEIGTDAGVYLRVNSSIYGGSVFVIFSGQGGIGWAYSNSSYSTSLP